MPYRFQITLSEEDELSFNVFHLLESPEGKKNLLRTRLIYIGISVLLCVAACLFVRDDPQFLTTYYFLFGGFILIGCTAAALRWGVDRYHALVKFIRYKRRKWGAGK